VTRELLSESCGQILDGGTALVLLIIGIYQIYYGLLEKYKKHVDKAFQSKHSQALLNSGKLGYVARGIVWTLLSFLFFKAAIYSNATEADYTSKAFELLEDSSYGPTYSPRLLWD
jgi:glucose uptake protein GlcU